MKRLPLFLLALSGATLLSTHAEAAPFSYNQTDLLLGFRSTGGTGASQDYLIDLGSITQFTSVAPGQSLVFTSSTGSAIGNIGADLQTFGTNWIQDSNLYWGAVAAGTSTSGPLFDAVFATKPETTPGTPVTGWTRFSGNTQAPLITNINTAGNGAAGNDTISANSVDATIQNDSESASWDSYMPGGSNSGGASNEFKNYFSGEIEGTFGNSSTAAGDTPIDLFEMLPTFSSGQKGAYLGTFTIDSSGDLTFTNETAVPEPGTYGLLSCGLGALVLLGMRRKPRLQS